MKKLIATMIIFTLSACGGAPAPQTNNYRNTYSPDSFASNLKKEGAYFISRNEFPDLYDAVINSNSSRLSDLLGHPSRVAYGSINNKQAVYIKTGKAGSRTKDSLLYYTMKKGKLQKADELLAEGAAPNSANQNGNTALLLVLNKKEHMPDRPALLKLLLKAGADPNIKNNRGNAPLHVAMGKNNSAPDTPALVQMLLKAGAAPNIKGYGSNTPLQMILQQGNSRPDLLTLTQMLLNGGADPNAVSGRGLTTLQAALNSGIANKIEVIKILMAHGANPDIKDQSSGQTALHTILRLLADGGASFDEEEALELLELIISADTDLNIRNKRGKTPLAYAFFSGRKKVEKYLLAKGATDYGIKNNAYDLPTEGNISVLGLGSAEIVSLDKDQCSFILNEYDVQFEHLSGINEVQIPIRLNSPVGGIKYSHTAGSKKFSIMDCRLAVTMIGWAPVLRKHQVKEVIHLRAFSPGATVGGGTKVSGHNYAMALDAAQFILNDDTKLVMNTDWTDRRHRADPCEPPDSGDSAAQETLRAIACDTGGLDLFSVILTPHYNKAHYDHLHMELTADQYMFVR